MRVGRRPTRPQNAVTRSDLPGGPITALSLGGLRRKVEALLMPDNIEVVLQLDRRARLERDARRRGGPARQGDYGAR